MAKISLREAMMDFVSIVLGEVINRDHMKNYPEVKEIVYEAMFKIALEYVDRADDVATKQMSLEIDRLNDLVESMRDNLNRRVNP